MILFQGFDVPNMAEVEKNIYLFCNRHSYGIHRAEFNFVDQDYMLELNQNSLKHDTHTDIITFDYSEDKNITIQVFISKPALKQNALKYGVEERNELYRLIAHGLLHCMGFQDKRTEDKRQMTLEENFFLSCFTWNT